MEKFLSHFQSTFSIPSPIMSLVSNIILNDSITYKKQNFSEYISLLRNNTYKDSTIPTILLLFSLDIHREFKGELTNQMKNIKSPSVIMFDFLSKLDFTLLSSKDVYALKSKGLILNNLFSFIKKTIDVTKDENLIQLFINNYYDMFSKGEISFLVDNINDDIASILIFMFNCVISVVGMNSKNEIEKIKIIKEKALHEIEREKPFVYSKKTRDFHFTLSSVFFAMMNKSNDDYEKEAMNFLHKISIKNNSEELFTYIKSFVNNYTGNSLIDIIAKSKIDFYGNILNKNTSIKNESISFFEFYLYFLQNNFKEKIQLPINDVFLVILTKLSTKSDFIELLSKSKIATLLVSKMRKEKEKWLRVDESFFDVCNALFKISSLKESMMHNVNEYITALLKDKIKPMIYECNLLSFLYDDKYRNTFSIFLSFIFGFDFDKKDINIIAEFSKIFFDFCNKVIKNNTFFIETYPPMFFNYVSKMSSQNLKWLNNLLITLEKNNTAYYTLTVNECYKLLSTSPNERKIILLITLLKPFRAQKKILCVNEDRTKIVLDNKKLNIKIELSLEELKQICIMNNETLTMIVLEFINEFEDFNSIFPIIYNVIKYNIKVANLEFKSGTMKSIKVFFDCYFEKIAKISNKKKKSESDNTFVALATKNITKVIKYIVDNIYDRPYENLISYLEMINFIIDFTDKYFSKIKNDSTILTFITDNNKEIYNQGMAFSLISLLRHSWYFVRFNSFQMLKREMYKDILISVKEELILAIKQSAFSLRQMDAEGSAFLLALLIHHMNSEFVIDVIKEIFSFSSIEISNKDILGDVIAFFNTVIKSKTDNYIKILNTNDKVNFDIINHSIHSHFIFLKTLIELNKTKLFSISHLPLLFNIADNIVELNTKFLTLLINNGVSEFVFGDDFDSGDNEDKLLISLWCTSKYSLSSLSLIYDIFTMNYASISSILSSQFEDKFLKPLSSSLNNIVSIIQTSKHMGVVKTMNESLYTICLLLNKSSEEFCEYRNIAKDKITKFISIDVKNEDLSSTLRRSAGIPYLTVSLIKSYISPSFSNKFINDLLKDVINGLLSNFTSYQYSNVDAAVHSLHILRVVIDDTVIKPYIKIFYDEIIMKIIDGLQSANWSIKNACMLMFSRVIKNNFSVSNSIEDLNNTNTFVEYFMEKKTLYNVVVGILEKNLNGSELNDCLLLFVTFFTKFKISKSTEYNDEELNKVEKLLFKMGKKNNKLFRKLLGCAVMKLNGLQYEKLSSMLEEEINEMTKKENIEKDEANNKGDFYYNVMNEIIKSKCDIEIKKKMISLYSSYITAMKAKIKENEVNYLLITKMIQLMKKNSFCSDISNLYDYSLIGVDHSKKTIDIFILLSQLNKNSRKFYFYKFIKHSLCFLFNNGYSLISSSSNENLLSAFKVLKYEELFVFLFKKFPEKISIELLSLDNINLIDYSVNISSRIATYISKHIEYLSSETKSNLLKSIIDIMTKYKEKSKLINKLFPLLTQLLPSKIDSISVNQILNLLLIYSDAANIDKLRINAVLSFEDMMNYLSQYDVNVNIDHLTILKILFLLLNDEYQGIRMKTCDVFMNYNNKYKFFDVPNINTMSYTNEFIIKKILLCKTRTKVLNEFYSFVLETNFYHNKNNKDSKVFYYEPDNRYIDNVESKLMIIRNHFKNGSLIEAKQTEPAKKIKMFSSLENLSIAIKEDIGEIIQRIGDKNEAKNIYSRKVRNIIY